MQIGTEGAHVIGFPYKKTGPDDGFTLVVRKKKNRKNRNRRATNEHTSAEKVERSLAELRSDLKWMEKCAKIIRDAAATLPTRIQTILCLGLGSPTEAAQARFQLCFLLQLRDSILPSPIRIQAFDPVFSPEDKLLLTLLGIEVLLDNKEGRHELEGTTLAFMPHCDRDLCENFLRANWTAASLSELLLIGNDLRGYADSIPARVLGKESPCISRLAPLVASTPVPEHQAFPNAFSTTAVQHVSPVSLSQIFTTPPSASSSQSEWWEVEPKSTGSKPIGYGDSSDNNSNPA